MTWTRDCPTEDACYWRHLYKEDSQSVVVYVVNAPKMIAVGTETEISPRLQLGEWFGPLEPPTLEERESQP